WCTYHPVYEQHVRQQCYTVQRPVWQEYQVPQRWCTYRPVYQQHVRQCCYTVQRPVWQEYQVPVKTVSYRPVYQQHTREYQEVCYRTVTEPRQMVYKTCTCEPVWTEKCYTVCTGSWHAEQEYIPGPIVNKCCRQPGTWCFDPCTCTSKYCPG